MVAAGPETRNRANSVWPFALVGCWGLAALGLSLSGYFERFDAATLMIAGLVPSPVYFITLLCSRRFRSLVSSLDVHKVTVMQAGRIIGGTAFALAGWMHWMSLPFAAFTAVSDIVVGFSSFSVARQLWPKHPLAFAVWHIAGASCLLGAGILGSLTSPELRVIGGPLTSQAVSLFPYSLVPIFLGPMMYMCHWIPLTQYFTSRVRADAHVIDWRPRIESPRHAASHQST